MIAIYAENQFAISILFAYRFTEFFVIKYYEEKVITIFFFYQQVHYEPDLQTLTFLYIETHFLFS